MMDPEKRKEVIEHLKTLNRIMLEKSKVVRIHNFTRKTQGKNYPISTGYSTQVRRPIRDLLKWMDKVEETIYLIVDMLEDDT